MSKTITIDGIKYIPLSEATSGKPAKSLKGKPYVIVRTRSAGVYAGYLDKRVGTEATVLNARLLYYWEGAASLSQLSQEGVKVPSACKFPMEVPSIELMDVISVFPCTEEARLSIAGVSVWKR